MLPASPGGVLPHPEPHKFTAVLTGHGPGLFLIVPFDVKKAFGDARPPVWVTLGTYRFRATIAGIGSRYHVSIREEHRAAAGVAAGQTVEAEIAFDDSVQSAEAPPELRAVIRGKKGLLAAWKKLSVARKTELAASILAEKEPAARAAQVSAVVTILASTPI